MLRHVHCYWKLLVFSCSQHVEAWLGFHDMLLWWSMKDVFWLTFSPGHTDPLDLINQDSNMFLINQELIFDTPRKTNMSPKSDHFSREYIFQPSIFRGHVSFQGSMMSRVGLLFLPPLGQSNICVIPLHHWNYPVKPTAHLAGGAPEILHDPFLKMIQGVRFSFQCHNWPYHLDTITLGRL